MADNYLQFSQVIANLTEAEEAWLDEQLQPICVVGEMEYPEDAVPAELADIEADWSGLAFSATIQIMIPIGKRWGSSAKSTTTVSRKVGDATCGSMRKNPGTRRPFAGWCGNFSGSFAPTNAGG